MTRDQAQVKFDEYALDDIYAEFIMNNSIGDDSVTNGNALIEAIEDGYLADEFIASLVTE